MTRKGTDATVEELVKQLAESEECEIRMPFSFHARTSVRPCDRCLSAGDRPTSAKIRNLKPEWKLAYPSSAEELA